jgi:predicted dehydrogenase
MTVPLRVATVGTGYFSRFHYNAWQRMVAEGLVDLVAICNRTPASAKEFADRYGITAVYDDIDTMLDETAPDLVDIITPPVTHTPYVRAAVARGVAAICQKPFTPDYHQAAGLVAHIEAVEGRVFIHEDFRFQPWYGAIKRLVDDGAVGDPYQVTFWLRPGDGQGPEAYLDRQPYFQQMPRFLIHETAIHLIDTFRYLFGEVNSVYADLVRLNSAIAGEDAGLILFDFANGRRGVFDGNRLADHPADNRRRTMGELCLEGSAGTITLDGNGVIRRRTFGSNDWHDVPYDWADIDFGGDCVYRTNRHVVDHLRDGTSVMNTAKDYLNNLRIEAAVYASADSGRKIDLPGFAP